MLFRFPRYWWGLSGTDLLAPTHSILQLIEAHVLDSPTAALLWALLTRRASIILVGGWARGTGKTTTLTALAGFLPGDTELVVARGSREDFSFLRETDGERTYIMVGEFSDHTPGYLWGDGAARAVRLSDQGYRCMGTMHADGPENLVAQWSEIGVEPSELARRIQLAVFQTALPSGDGIASRVTGVHWLQPAARGPWGMGAKSLVSWSPPDDRWTLFSSPDTWADLARWGGATAEALQEEFVRRATYLTKLVSEGPRGFDVDRERLLGFQGDVEP